MFQAKPLDHLHITQPYGANGAPFYKQLGLIAHNGIDFEAATGTPTYAVCDGTIIAATSVEDAGSMTKGRYVYLESNPVDNKKLQIVYFHLEHVIVKLGDKVVAGQQLGTTDNSGQYTTGPHLHFGVSELVFQNGAWVNLNKDNGFGGAINSESMFPEGWITNPSTNATYGLLLSWEGRLIKSNTSPIVYLVKGGKLQSFPDELTVWSNGFSLARIDTVDAQTIETATVSGEVTLGNKIDAQILKEMVALLGNEPARATTLFSKYF